MKKHNLKEEFPEISKEWHLVKNGNLKPENFSCSSHKRIVWKCSSCGNDWESFINFCRKRKPTALAVG
jgi:hypothetical protein